MTDSLGSALQGVCIIENDNENESLAVWCFPNIHKTIKDILQSQHEYLSHSLKSSLATTTSTTATSNQNGDSNNDNKETKETNSKNDEKKSFVFSKYKNNWLYTNTCLAVNQETRVQSVSLCLVTTSFNPAKYELLSQILLQLYIQSWSPLPVMEHYLKAFAVGDIKTKFGNYQEQQFDDRRALISPIKGLLSMFGTDIMIIWTAMLQKKRVFVYSSDINELLNVVRALPLIGAWHRLDFSILRPFVLLNPLQLGELKSAGVYVAGFNDIQAQNKSDLYDLFIDVSNRSIYIPEHSKSDFVMTKFHQDLAQQMMTAAESENDQGLIKFIALKTKEFLVNIQSLKVMNEQDGHAYITLEHLHLSKLPPHMDRFIFNVALAEKMTKN